MNGVLLECDIQDADGCTFLRLACQNQRPEAAKALLAGRKDLKVNIKNKNGETALRKLCADMVNNELSRDLNADPNITNHDGQTALHIAAPIGNV